MNTQDKRALIKDLDFHLDRYRDARDSVIRSVGRGKPILANDDQSVGLHAFRLAEILDRLDGKTS